jgi:cyclophilin family peptidyl-prolyl cis-trans isomerase
MWNRNHEARRSVKRFTEPTGSVSLRRRAFQPTSETLEVRWLMTASLSSINPVSVPSLQGLVVPLDGSGTSDAQTFTAVSSNPDIKASVTQGEFWTLNVSYTDPSNPANNFSGPLTFQLFQSLTPNTVNEIESIINSGFYNGKTFHRIVTSFSGAADGLVQGGAVNADGTGTSGLPGTPFGNEPVQSLAFSGGGLLALANNGLPNSDDSQFFVTTAAEHSLDYGYTVFGELVAGQSMLAKMLTVPTTTNPGLGGEQSLPINPVKITSSSLSTTNPNGAVLLDASQAKPGETATITVTATDTVDHTTQSQAFLATVGSYAGINDPPINFTPIANPTAPLVLENTPTTVKLAGQSGYPDASRPSTLTYALTSSPAHGSVSQFNPVTGTFVYTPNPGFLGTDTFQYQVTAQGPNATPATLTSNPGQVSVSVNVPPPPVTLTNVRDVRNKRGLVTEVVATFSGPVNASEAQIPQIYRLAGPNKRGSYTAKNSPVIRLKSAAYDPTTSTVTLIPNKPFALSTKVQFTVLGSGAASLLDPYGRMIDGDHDGTPGGDGVAYLTRRTVTVI